MSYSDNSDLDESLFVNNSDSDSGSDSEKMLNKPSKPSNSDNDSDNESNSNSDNEFKDSNDEDSDNEESIKEESIKEDSENEESENEESESENEDSENEDKVQSKKEVPSKNKDKIKKEVCDLPDNIDFSDDETVIKYIKDNLKLDMINLNRCISNLTNINETTDTGWGNNKYSTMHAMYEYLNLFVGFSDKLNDNNDIFKLNKFKITKMFCRKASKNIKKEYKSITVDSFDEIFQVMKDDDNKSFWEIIDTIFNMIYPNAEFENIPDTVDSNKESQKNNLYGIKLFQLVTHEYITDTSMFNDFEN